eukprot:evm.model.scf_5.6 EVM.evm.TU.scf_5.6   scf_5:60235-68550(-)
MAALARFEDALGPEKDYYKQDELFWKSHAEKVQSYGKLGRGGQSLALSQTAHPATWSCGNGSAISRECPGVDQQSLLLDALLLPGTVSSAWETPEKHIELHKRVVELASVRSSLHNQLRTLQGHKASLNEQKLTLQSRIVSRLNSRLHAAYAVLDDQQSSVQAKMGQLERHTLQCARILQRLVPEPTVEEWAELASEFQRLHRFKAEVAEDAELGFNFETLAPKAEADLERELAEAKNIMSGLQEELQICREGRVEVDKLLDQKCQEVNAWVQQCTELQTQLEDIDKDAVVVERLRDARSQFQQVLQALEEKHQKEVERLESLFKDAVGGKDGSEHTDADSHCSAREMDLDVEPVQQLRKTMTLPPGNAAKPACGREARLREMYLKMLMQIKHRNLKEREKSELRHKEEMQALVKTHEDTIARLLAQFNKQGMGPATDGNDVTEMKLLKEENNALKEKMDKLSDAFDSRLEYALYSQRCEHEKEIIGMKDMCEKSMEESKMETCGLRDALAAQQEIMTPEKMKSIVNDAIRAKDAEHHADLLRANDMWQQKVDAVEDHYKSALTKREGEYDQLLNELRRIQQTHNSTCSSSEASHHSGAEPQARPKGKARTLSPQTKLHTGKRCSASIGGSSPAAIPGVAGFREEGMQHDGTGRPAPCLGSCVGSSGASVESQTETFADAVLTSGTPLEQCLLADGNQRTANAIGRTARCARCGLNDEVAPGHCCFHPALLRAPGPMLYSPEWHTCKVSHHSASTPGCYSRREHYYPIDPGVGRGSLVGPGTSWGSMPSPRPRAVRPMPSYVPREDTGPLIGS